MNLSSFNSKATEIELWAFQPKAHDLIYSMILLLLIMINIILILLFRLQKIARTNKNTKPESEDTEYILAYKNSVLNRRTLPVNTKPFNDKRDGKKDPIYETIFF